MGRWAMDDWEHALLIKVTNALTCGLPVSLDDVRSARDLLTEELRRMRAERRGTCPECEGKPAQPGHEHDYRAGRKGRL